MSPHNQAGSGREAQEAAQQQRIKEWARLNVLERDLLELSPQQEQQEHQEHQEHQLSRAEYEHALRLAEQQFPMAYLAPQQVHSQMLQHQRMPFYQMTNQQLQSYAMANQQPHSQVVEHLQPQLHDMSPLQAHAQAITYQQQQHSQAMEHQATAHQQPLAHVQPELPRHASPDQRSMIHPQIRTPISTPFSQASQHQNQQQHQGMPPLPTTPSASQQPRGPHQLLTTIGCWQQRSMGMPHPEAVADSEPDDDQMDDESLSYEDWPPAVYYHSKRPKHHQMSAKTDGQTIFVRKTDLLINFHRTRAVPDDGNVHAPVRSRGELEVYPVKMYPQVFSLGTSGVFIGMKEKASLRVTFETRLKCGRNPYLIRIYAGAINIISGKADLDKDPNDKTQDYIVVPDQAHIDGFALNTEKARQFQAPTEGAGFTFDWPCEAGQLNFRSLRFEITPFEFENVGDFFVKAKGWMDRGLMVPACWGKRADFSGRIEKYFGIDRKLVQWEYGGRKFPNDWTVDDVGIPPDPERHRNNVIYITPTNSTNHSSNAPTATRNPTYRHFLNPLPPDFQAGQQPKTEHQIAPTLVLTPGGQIEQILAYDPYPNFWNPQRTTIIEVHIVSDKKFDEIMQMPAARGPRYAPRKARRENGCEEEVDAYQDEADYEADEEIEKFEIRDFRAPYAEVFTSVRDYVAKRER
ncbi:hypothetical protein K458DRAFT_401008 [Lentithecium fluviatile CBS 122367]|uniref:Uncharacterized protein n=1 Tax=Lentithecium fluviatile CBS 122367 TaxID=1168545 RepID=A0A6G1JF97_9PLEO|nr:hypothetical protein K458DRAFT_401008 [Lentithecium fluviatile CBS 122367]